LVAEGQSFGRLETLLALVGADDQHVDRATLVAFGQLVAPEEKLLVLEILAL
jgi:hypothetical protein